MIGDPFTIAVNFILPHEEEFARGHWGDEAFVVPENVSGDNGGLTKYGIDQASHPGIDIAHLTRAGAIDIYHEEWERHQLDLLPPKLAVATFDVMVNGGRPGLWLQHAYNVTHPTAPQLTEDGALGPKSIAALQSSDQDAILQLFFAERDARFKHLATLPHDAQFLAGWLQRDHDLERLLTS